MGLFGNKDKEISAHGAYISGLEGVPKTTPFKVTLNDEFVTIDELTLTLKGFTPLKTFNIPIENILTIEVVTEENIKELSKSVIKRGVVGGVVFGPAGLILGGLSGVGNKQKKEKVRLLCVSYQPKDNADINTIIFKQHGGDLNAYTLVKEYKKRFATDLETETTVTL